MDSLLKWISLKEKGQWISIVNLLGGARNGMSVGGKLSEVNYTSRNFKVGVYG